MRTIVTLTASLLLSLSANADPIRGKNSLAEAADTLAADIQTYLKDKGEKAVTLGDVRYTGRGQ